MLHYLSLYTTFITAPYIFIYDHGLCGYTSAEPTRIHPCNNGNAQQVETLKRKTVEYADNRAVSFFFFNRLLNLKDNAILYQFEHDCRRWSAFKTVKRCRGYIKMLLASVNDNTFICDLPTAPVRFSFA